MVLAISEKKRDTNLTTFFKQILNFPRHNTNNNSFRATVLSFLPNFIIGYFWPERAKFKFPQTQN